MSWRIELSAQAEKVLFSLDRAAINRIDRFIKERLATADNPRLLGKPLKGALGVFWRYRVGDCRLIGSIEDEKVTLLVVRIGHRRDVYKKG